MRWTATRLRQSFTLQYCLLWTDACSVHALDTDSRHHWTVTSYGQPYSYSQWTGLVNNSHMKDYRLRQPFKLQPADAHSGQTRALFTYLTSDGRYHWTATCYGQPYSYSQRTGPVNNSHLKATCNGQPLAMDSNSSRAATQPGLTASCYGQPLAMDIRLISTVTCPWTAPLVDSKPQRSAVCYEQLFAMDKHLVRRPLAFYTHSPMTAARHGLPLVKERPSCGKATLDGQPPTAGSYQRRTATHLEEALTIHEHLP